VNGRMSGGRRSIDFLLLGVSAFILSKALLSLILEPGDTPTDGNTVFKLILTVGYVGAAALLVRYYRDTLFVIRRNWSLAVLLFLALVSFIWADSPALVLQRSIAVFGATLLGIAMAIRLSVEDQLRLLSWLLRIIAALSLVCVLLFPEYGISGLVLGQREWQGVFPYKNALGSVMALSLLVEWHLPAHTRFAKIMSRLAMLLSAVLLFFSGSITPLVALLGSLIFVGMYKFAAQRLRIPMYAIVLAILLIVATGFSVLLAGSQSVTDALGRTSDLTGRTEIWTIVASIVPARPVLGYGYEGFWFGASPESQAIDQAMGETIVYSHNGYLEVLLNLGAIGLLLTLAFLGAGVKRAFHFAEGNRSSVALWPLAFLLFCMLHNMGECTILMQDLEWAVCVAAVLSADAALFAPQAVQQEELLLVPSEEF
jgi:exopolysaccharide production protein ExoQ